MLLPCSGTISQSLLMHKQAQPTAVPPPPRRGGSCRFVNKWGKIESRGGTAG